MSKKLFQRWYFWGGILLLALLIGGILFGTLRQAKPIANENGIAQTEEHYWKLRFPLKESSAKNLGRKLNRVLSLLSAEATDAYYAIIPDKNFYLEHPADTPFDYAAFLDILRQNTSGMTYIDLFPALELSDYYKTDLHWRQECLSDVTETLSGALSVPLGDADWRLQSYPSFVGSYGRLADGDIPPEELCYLTGRVIQNAGSENFQHPDFTGIYDTAKLESDTPYNVFLSGPTPIVTLTNPDVPSERELLLFGDSFASSLAPLLLEGYRSITLVDLRFLDSSLLAEHITYTDQDILFLYSTAVANSSEMLKVSLSESDNGT